MKFKLLSVALLSVGILAACGDEKGANGEQTPAPVEPSTSQPETKEPTTTQGQTDDIKALVESYSSNKTTDEQASITSTQLIVTDKEGNETTYELPEEEFFVSIAPYINQTHPCTNHSLTGCQGELVSQEFDVFIENEKGEVIVDEKITTLENGFFDLWLPRNQAYIIQIEQDGKKVEGGITTFEEDGTCITTLQLK
ncbi:MAG: CueP family metal-binding protein [Solibacillus sp.]